ncbi:nucleotidyltransferase [Candidatus Nitrospira bockiana]
METIGRPQDAAHQFYRDTLRLLKQSGVPFLVGGAFAMEAYAGVTRRTKDLDVFVRPEHAEPLLAYLSKAGYETEMRFPHWLGKARQDDHYLDIIFSSGNGICTVDDLWFEHAFHATVVGVPVPMVPPEEMIWSKAFIMERERYDGADIAHLLRARSKSLDWARLLYRFNSHWRVLFSHLILFGFIYPAQRLQIPAWIMEEMIRRLRVEMSTLPSDQRLCQGTLLSWSQYLVHTQGGDYEDARHHPRGPLTRQETRLMTDTLLREQKKAG